MRPELKMRPNPDICRHCGHSLWNHRTDRRVGCIHSCSCTYSAISHRQETFRLVVMNLIQRALIG